MAQYLQSLIEVLEKHHPQRAAAYQARDRPGLRGHSDPLAPGAEASLPVVILVLHSDRDGDQEFGVWEDAHGWL